MGDSIGAWCAGAALGGMACVLLFQFGALRKRLARVEGKLLKNAGLQYDPFSDVPEDVAEAVRSGNKVLAVKRYREATGCDLRKAREEIDDLFRVSGVGATVDADGGKALLIVMPCIIVCSLAGALLPLLFWMPDPGSYMLFVVMAPGGIAGAFIGLVFGIIIFRKVQKRELKTE